MKYFLFPKLNSNHFLFLTYFVIYTVRTLIKEKSHTTNDICETFNYYYLYSFSDFLSIIPLIIIQKRTKTTKIFVINQTNNERNSEKEEEYIFTDTVVFNKEKVEKKVKNILIIISIFDFFAIYLKVIYSIIIKKSAAHFKNLNLNSELTIYIIARYLSNRIILHYYFYRHHYLSFFINIVFLIVLDVKDIIEISEKDNNLIASLFFIFTRILSSILYSIEDAYAKIIITYNSFSPYNYLFIRGIIVNILVVIFSFIFIFVDIPDENGVNSIVFTRFWKIYDNKINILIYFILFIIDFLYNVNVLFIIDKFSSSHLAVLDIIGQFGSLLNTIFFSDSLVISEIVFRLIIYFILILAALIHNEFIILNFCGFQRQTKLFLEIEAEKDKNQTINLIDIDEGCNIELGDFTIYEKMGLDSNND